MPNLKVIYEKDLSMTSMITTNLVVVKGDD